jgi:glycosyltransferase involved in cell wall biosynthesis
MHIHIHTIAIVCWKSSDFGCWDPESVHSGISGSEEAVIYGASELARRDYRVVVYANPPVNSKHCDSKSNPRYVDCDEFWSPPVAGEEQQTKFDVIVCWRQPQIAAQCQQRAQQVYLWPHDLPSGTISTENVNALTGVLWLSAYQRQLYHSYTPTLGRLPKGLLLCGNGISDDPATAAKPAQVQERTNAFACIYASNYAKGLPVLLQHWPDIKKRFAKASLDIYYGWKHWGNLSPAQEAELRATVASLHSLDVREHGQVSHSVLMKAFASASLWTYPCTYDEMFAITSLRAQVAGCIPVIVNRSSLTETVNKSLAFTCDTTDQFLQTCVDAMENVSARTLKDVTEQRIQLRQWVLNQHTWSHVVDRWQKLFVSESEDES